MREPEMEPAQGRFRRMDAGRSHGILWTFSFAGLAFAVALTCIAQDGRPAPPREKVVAQTAPSTNQANPALTKSDSKKQISTDSAQLLAMAVALKAEVDKTNKDVLSINVIRKADEIEKLAHTVKEKMKKSGPS